MRLQTGEAHLGVAEGRQGVGCPSQLRAQCRRPLVVDEWSTTLRAELRWAADALATLRDTEVHLARLETHAALLPPEDRERAVRIRPGGLEALTQPRVDHADGELRSERHLRLLTDLVEAAREPRFASAADEPGGAGRLD